MLLYNVQPLLCRCNIVDNIVDNLSSLHFFFSSLISVVFSLPFDCEGKCTIFFFFYDANWNVTCDVAVVVSRYFNDMISCGKKIESASLGSLSHTHTNTLYIKGQNINMNSIVRSRLRTLN